MLASASDLKTYLGITATTYDTYFAQLMAGVDATVKRWLGRSIEAVSDVTEYVSGRGVEYLYLRNRPVTAISSLFLDGGGYGGRGTDAFAADTELDIGVDWIPASLDEDERNTGKIIRLNAVWPRGVQNIKVVHDHGYAAVPANVKLACLMIGAMIRTGREKGRPVSQEGMGDYSYQMLALGGAWSDASAELVEARGLLRPYRNIAV